jgi:thiol-disulfide isomerase/thioredoxin
MRHQSPIFLAVAALAATLVIAGIYVTFWAESNDEVVNSTASVNGGLQALTVGEMANFTVFEAPERPDPVSFVDSDGNERSFDDWKGQVVLVNLWATWCGPCRHEMPALDRLQAELGSDAFEVLAISLDRSGLDLPKAFYAENNIEHLALYNDASSRTGVALGVFGMPTTVLLDREGRLVGRLVGPAEWDAPDAVALMQAAIGGVQ